MIRCYKTAAFAAALLSVANAGASGDMPYDRYASRYAPDLPLARYQAARHERTSRIQIGSRSNAWLKEGGNADWVYDYDAWKVALG